MDDRLAYHVASLFVRDPIPTYDYEHDETQFDSSKTTAHFENLQSSNWNSMRFKPPPSVDSKIGWRVEFRTMDIQMTDFENSALIVTLGMILNVINNYDVNLIMPISKIDENMERAHMRDGVLTQKFWFKSNIVSKDGSYKENKLKSTDYLISNNGTKQSSDNQMESEIQSKSTDSNASD